MNGTTPATSRDPDRPDVEQLGPQQARQEHRRGDAGNEARGSEPHALAENHREHATARRPHRHVDADLLAALA